MSSSGVTVAPECDQKLNDLKLGKYSYVVFKLSDDRKSIVVDSESDNKDYEVFREYILEMREAGKPSPRYIVYNFEVDNNRVEGSKNKVVFITWSPDSAGIKLKTLYSSSKENLKRSLNGIAMELQATDEGDLEYESIISKIQSRGKRS